MEQFELIDFDFNCTEAKASYNILNKISVIFTLIISPNLLEIELEPDGCPAYVPYGCQMVLYDDGKGEIIDIDARNAVDVDERDIYLDIDNETDISDYSNVELAKILNITEEEVKKLFDDLEANAEQLTIDAAAEFYLTHQDCLPEDLLYPEEPDYTY